MDRVPMSRTGFEKLKGEVEEMKNVKMPEIVKEIAVPGRLVNFVTK